MKSEKMRAAASGFTNLVQPKDGKHTTLGRYVGQDLLVSSSLLSFRGVNSKPQGPWLEGAELECQAHVALQFLGPHVSFHMHVLHRCVFPTRRRELLRVDALPHGA